MTDSTDSTTTASDPTDTGALRDEIHAIGARARVASRALGKLGVEDKNRILHAMADAVEARRDAILEANARDVAAARANGLTGALVDRLVLDPKRVAGIADGIRQVAGLADPVGQIMDEWERPNGLSIQQKRVPIGVIGIIYESRPNVTSDAAVLCFKAGNATILRGGRDARESNLALAAALQDGGAEAGLPAHSIQLIAKVDRASVKIMAEMDEFLDLIIPRGGPGLIETVVSLARMPVIKHYDGICHTYVDKSADLSMATAIVVNAKTQKPGVCNALETLLVHRSVADSFLPVVGAALREKGVEIRGDEATVCVLGDGVAGPATEKDWQTEYLDLILAIRVVRDIDAAVSHINHYGSHHSDCIVSTDRNAAETFLAEVDSAAVFWNSSTRFNDGEEFGFGAEIGISTDKLHARGPMALRELTSYKYLVRGDGQVK